MLRAFTGVLLAAPHASPLKRARKDQARDQLGKVCIFSSISEERVDDTADHERRHDSQRREVHPSTRKRVSKKRRKLCGSRGN